MQNQQVHTQNSETQPLVTFIVTNYNIPTDLLIQCIDSILALSLRPFEREIIVVDDGSTESPIESLQKYNDDIIYVRKSNGGISTARNMGLKMATGKYVQFVDGDDMLVTAVYEHCLDMARYQKVDIIAFNFTHQKNDTVVYEDWPEMSGVEMVHRHNLQGATCLYIFRRSIVGKLTYTPGICYGEDEEFTPQLFLRAEKIIRTTAKAYYYRQRQGSVINNTTPEAIQQRLSDNLQVITNLSNIADTLPYKERLAMGRRVAQLTMDYIYNTIVLTKKRQQLDLQLDKLRSKGLFPLPDHDYTSKYKWFRRLTNTKIGLALLMKTLPLIQKEE
jgi:glycosyltransferase involved in cell wall biosynthesis